MNQNKKKQTQQQRQQQQQRNPEPECPEAEECYEDDKYWWYKLLTCKDFYSSAPALFIIRIINNGSE